MSQIEIRAAGGFCAPVIISGTVSGGVITHPGSPNEFRLFSETFRNLTAVRGGIDFSPPEVRWAREREREMRALTQMWDWPR